MHYGINLRNHVVVDLSQSHVVDHSVMEKLHSLQSDFVSEGLTLEIRGLHAHQPVSEHWLSTRRLVLPKLVRLTVLVDFQQEQHVLRRYQDFGGTESRSMLCSVVSSSASSLSGTNRVQRVQIEMLTSERISRMMLNYLSQEILPGSGLAATIERVHGLAIKPTKKPSQPLIAHSA